MTSNTTRITNNFFIHYFRQIVNMLVTLYTFRLVIKILGESDYGIYTLVGGVVVLFTFATGAMTSSTQRFLNYAIGLNDTEKARNVFSVSFVIYILIAALIVVLAQTVGLWFFYTWLNIPPERQTAAFVVYQFSVATMVITILQIPYKATIIAHEKMSFFAILTIIEAAFKLGNIFLLQVIFFDKLIVYVFIICLAEIVIFMTYKLYCNKNFAIANFRYCKDKELFRQLLLFSGWSLFGSLAEQSRAQGTNMLLNIYYNVVLNAAIGMATQVGVAVCMCLQSFQTAFSPQIVKSYSVKDYEYFTKLIFCSAKVSFCLLFVFVLPLFLNVDFVLQVYFGDVPEYTAAFTRLILLSSLISAIIGPLGPSIQATGDIKRYQFIAGCFIFACLPLSLLFLRMGFSPVWVLGITFGMDVVMAVWRIFFVGGRVNISAMKFFREVIAPLFIIASVSVFITSLLGNFFINWAKLIIICIISTINISCLMYWIGLNRQEKVLFKNWVKIAYLKIKA